MKAAKPDPVRSLLMARVRQKGTKAELVVATALRELGASYRLNVRSLPGSPDFANKLRGWAIFVHGCFWHQHDGCRRATIPKSNTAFWIDKFHANKIRDQRAVDALEKLNYRVAIIWECETDNFHLVRKRLSEILETR